MKTAAAMSRARRMRANRFCRRSKRLFATPEWVDRFNHRRLLEPIGNIPPAKAQARCYAQTEDVAMAA